MASNLKAMAFNLLLALLVSQVFWLRPACGTAFISVCISMSVFVPILCAHSSQCFHVCAHICSHMCAFTCVLCCVCSHILVHAYLCPDMCALMLAKSYQCPMSSYVCFHVSRVCLHAYTLTSVTCPHNARVLICVTCVVSCVSSRVQKLACSPLPFSFAPLFRVSCRDIYLTPTIGHWTRTHTRTGVTLLYLITLDIP